MKLVCRNEKIDINKKTLWELIDELLTSRKIEKSTFYVFETLRDYRNTNTHTAKKFPLDERMTLLQHAHNLCEWFMASRVDKNYQRRGFSMPQKGQQYYQQVQQAYIPPYVNYAPYENYSQPKTEQRKTVHPMPDKKFFKLCEYGDANKIIKALKEGANPNARGEFDYTPLIEMAKGGLDIKVAQALIKAGADVNAKNISGKTALMEAANGGDIEGVKFLIKAGAKVNDKDSNGYTVLNYAASGGETECVKILLNAGVNVHDDYTALAGAASSGKCEIVKMLLKAGADINNSKSVLIPPACCGNHKMIEFLLRAGADVNRQGLWGRTAIMAAIDDINFTCPGFRSDRFSVNKWVDKLCKTIEILIKAGADVSIKDNKGKTALDLAISELYQYLDTEQHKKIESLLKPKRSFLSRLFN